ncbi:protein-export chaperone SecB [Buchnera aphidicola]|nr:protein-export chaperone SecB [Buchnera aphidicola]WAI03003.1 MAG: protein-export chaperone SecB [Buchnera aphidicola (Myzus persicae)]
MSETKINKKFFEIQRIYIKDVSFEAPNTPNVFHLKWEPIVKFNLNTFSKKIEKNIFEIILQIKVIVKIKEKIVFLCDVDQAGIFFISDYNEKKINYYLYSYCPNILFPYARECISGLVSHASFPQMNIMPINFDDIYKNHIKFKKNSV